MAKKLLHGSIRKRNNGVLEFRISMSGGENQIQKSFYGKSEDECMQKYYKFISEQYQEDEKNDYLVSDYLSDWYKTKERDLKPASLNRIRVTINSNILPYIGNMSLDKLSPLDVDKMMMDLQREGKSQSTIKKAYDIVNESCRYALGDYIEFNPCDKVRPPKRRKHKKDNEIIFLNKEEIERFKQVCFARYKNGMRKYRQSEAYIFMLNTGIRTGEMLALTWKDIKDDMISINKNLVKVGNQTILQDTPKTFASEREVPLNQTAKDCLKALHIMNHNNKYIVRGKNTPYMNYTSFLKTYNRIIDYAGIDKSKHGLHTLRHTFASILFENDVDIKYISAWLGHESVSTTYNKYIHLIKEKEKDVFKTIDNI